MKKKICKLLIIIVIIVIVYNIKEDINYVYNNDIVLNNYINNKVKYNDINGYLKIDKINFIHSLYDINSKNNNVDNGLMFIEKNNSRVILGHSGHSVKALFNDLDKLEINDLVHINYNNESIIYKVVDISIKLKSDKLSLNSDLLLVTCLKNTNDKQLVIRCQKIDKNTKI